MFFHFDNRSTAITVWLLLWVLRYWCSTPAKFFSPKYRLGHPENYLCLLSKKIFSGSKYPKNILFNFEKGSTVQHVFNACELLLKTVRKLSHKGSRNVVLWGKLGYQACNLLQNTLTSLCCGVSVFDPLGTHLLPSLACLISLLYM